MELKMKHLFPFPYAGMTQIRFRGCNLSPGCLSRTPLTVMIRIYNIDGADARTSGVQKVMAIPAIAPVFVMLMLNFRPFPSP